MIGIDANVPVRYIVQGDEEQAAIAFDKIDKKASGHRLVRLLE